MRLFRCSYHREVNTEAANRCPWIRSVVLCDGAEYLAITTGRPAPFPSRPDRTRNGEDVITAGGPQRTARRPAAFMAARDTCAGSVADGSVHFDGRLTRPNTPGN